MMRRMVSGGCALLLAGCSMAPAWQRPALPVPAALPQGGAYPDLAAGSGAIDSIGWQQFFADARLQRVIAAALANNRNLRATIANVAAARAQYRVVRAAQVPTINATAAANVYHGSVSAGGYTGGATGSGGATADTYGVSGGAAAFELDLWGRVRNLGESALQSWLAGDEGRKAAQITLVAEVARSWLTIGATADALAVAQETLTGREAALTIARAREAQGIGTVLAVAQADTLVQTARADVAAYTTALARATNALHVLAGTTVPATDLPTSLGAGDAVLASLPVGLDSAVLLQRPDVLAAEHRLRAVNADLGVARAALFPQISLTGLVGLASGSLGGLFDAGGRFNWGASAGASQTLFDGGAKAGTIAVARARREAAMAQYEGAVQSAFADVANALARRGTIDAQERAGAAYLASTDQAATIIRARYDQGIDTGLAALDADRTVYAARQALIATRLERASNMVTLYAVLGGGLQR